MAKRSTDAAVEMICSVGELANLFRRGQNLRDFLRQVVATVKSHMRTDVCSVYLFDEDTDRLTLEATDGLNADLVGEFSLASGEGLTGLSLKELRPIREGRGGDSPYFKPAPGSGEEQFQSFMAVPIIRGVRRVGVLVAQDQRTSHFTRDDAQALRAIATQLATTLENAQILIGARKTKPQAHRPVTGDIFQGTPISEGVALGRAFVMEGPSVDAVRVVAGDGDYGVDIEAFRSALAMSENQLEELQNQLDEELVDVASLIFSAHLLMLRDEGFSGSMEELIAAGTPAPRAVESVANQYIDIFAVSDNPRLREKVVDIKDLGHRILRNLSGGGGEVGDYVGQIVMTEELLPSELLKLAAQRAEGLVLHGGGSTAHIAILARSLGIPLVTVDDSAVFRIPNDTPLALDGFQGALIVHPDENAVARFEALRSHADNLEDLQSRVRDETITACGSHVKLRATVNILADLKIAIALKADGIGLYRSEIPFLVRSDFPSEEEQYRVYRKVVEAIDDPVVTLRTLDVGGDKILGYLPDAKESNPFLGLRAIRFLLENKKVFVGQLKAMLRAADHRRIRIMFPLIASVDEFRRARNMVKKSMQFLERDGYRPPPEPELGVMVELPSAVEMASELAKEADFLSLGTNDLVQYMLGVDRTNEKVADLFETRHPAVLRAAKRVADAAGEAGCPLSVCGAMAEDPVTVYYFLGLGIREFSVEPAKIPLLQEAVAEVKLEEARRNALQLASLGTIGEVKTKFAEIFPIRFASGLKS